MHIPIGTEFLNVSAAVFPLLFDHTVLGLGNRAMTILHCLPPSPNNRTWFVSKSAYKTRVPIVVQNGSVHRLVQYPGTRTHTYNINIFKIKRENTKRK